MAFSNDASDSAATKEGRKRKWSEPERRPSPIKWRTQTEQKSYSSKFLEALHRVRRSTPEVEAPRRSRALREAADRALAVAARGRTRWSRAILSSRSRLMIKPRRPRPVVPSASVGVYAAAKKNKKRKSPVLKGKAAALGRLVPGCEKISFPSLLEEASDYIPALEMQVRAMAALVAILSASSGSSSAESNNP